MPSVSPAGVGCAALPEGYTATSFWTFVFSWEERRGTVVGRDRCHITQTGRCGGGRVRPTLHPTGPLVPPGQQFGPVSLQVPHPPNTALPPHSALGLPSRARAGDVPHLPAWGPCRFFLLSRLLLLHSGAPACGFHPWGPHLPLLLRPELSLLLGRSSAPSSRCLGGHGLQGGAGGRTWAERPAEPSSSCPVSTPALRMVLRFPKEGLPFSASCKFPGGGGLPPSLGLPCHELGCLCVTWSSDRSEPHLPWLASSRP